MGLEEPHLGLMPHLVERGFHDFPKFTAHLSERTTSSVVVLPSGVLENADNCPSKCRHWKHIRITSNREAPLRWENRGRAGRDSPTYCFSLLRDRN